MKTLDNMLGSLEAVKKKSLTPKTAVVKRPVCMRPYRLQFLGITFLSLEIDRSLATEGKIKVNHCM